MAITKEIVQDKIEIVGEFKNIHVRTATVIKEDGVELSRSFHRHVVNPNSDSSNESADVKALVTQFHTDEVKKAFTDYLAKQNL
tara:strand:- start:513 stop:764 length:252 start_codon:yes stop_codon:yes gene_type:complete